MWGYLPFLAANPRFLAFGFLAAFFSGFGQTFFLAFFGGEIRVAFDLGHGGLGAIYSGATLASGVLLIWLGRLVDRVALWRYTAGICAGLVLACFAMAAAQAPWMLVLAYFGLRLAGQGLLSHLSTVAMARQFVRDRGKAVSLAAFGYPISEALLPLIAIALLAVMDWRTAWLVIGLVLLAGLTPMMLALLGQSEEATSVRTAPARSSERKPPVRLGRDPVFYILVTCMLAPSFIVTGLFFHQAALAESKGWSLSWLASSFIAFAIAQVCAGLVSGAAVDRFGTARMLPVYMLPLAGGALVIASFDHWLSATLYLALAGLTAGGSHTVMGALWADLYGTARLGAIRALVQALMVFSTAASPLLFGSLLDLGVGFAGISLACAAYILVASAVLFFMLPTLRVKTLRSAGVGG